ncbi:MAG TPA: hypothetical protein VK003_21295 [Oceanobacillus sp.]|nr:hypothetical protein [Oceanobacillus sp.]
MIDREREYQRAARLLGSKLGVDWRTLPREQVEEYMRKLEIAGQACLAKNRRKRREGSDPA